MMRTGTSHRLFIGHITSYVFPTFVWSLCGLSQVSHLCFFAKNCLISKQEKYVSLSGGETLFCLFIGNIQQEVTVSTTATTTLHIYYYLFHYKFTTYYLWPWKSRLGFNYQDIILKKVLLSQTPNTTATTLNSYAILLTTRN
jgi:hypothetical protein